MSEEQRRQLQQQLWNIANTLRGKMNADEFRDYILGFIFYKYLSEKIQRFADGELAQENLKFASLSETTKEGQAYISALEAAALDELGYFLKPSELFHAIAKKGNNQLDSEGAGDSHNFILDDLTRILKNIEQSTLGTDSADDFVNLFEDLDLTSSKLGKTVKEKNEIVSKVLSHLDNIDFNLSDTEGDVLGDAYEYLIGQFASGAGKKAGEFYTPQPVSTLLAKLVTDENKQIRSIYDAACGSGSLLLRVKKVYDPKGDKKVKIYGQELNRTTYNLCRMNMIMHDVHYDDFDIKQEDTLERPQHIGLRFDAIVANPPFSAPWNASPLMMNDDRYSQYGRLAPSTKADMAFMQHMVHHLSEDGTMAIILPHGVLFRGAAERHIRQYLIEHLNYLDAVIGLPANMFHGDVTIAVTVLVLKKCRKNPDNILFIDASQHFDKVKTKNVMRPEHIQKIVDTYKAWTNEEKYSQVATTESIKANNYNLNIPKYVDTLDAEDAIDLQDVINILRQLEENTKVSDDAIFKFCEELEIPPPNGNNAFWLNQYKKAVMQQIFSQELRFKDDDGLDFPEWEEEALGNLLDYEQPTKYLVSSTEYSDEFKTPVLTAGKTFILGYTDETVGICGQNLPVIIFDDFTTAFKFVTFPFKAKSSAMKILRKKAGTNINYVYFAMMLIDFPSGDEHKRYWISEYSKVTVPLPSEKEQTKIANFLTAIDDKLNQMQIQLAAAKQYKQGLLQQMFV